MKLFSPLTYPREGPGCAGVRLVGVSIDENGVVLDALEVESCPV